MSTIAVGEHVHGDQSIVITRGDLGRRAGAMFALCACVVERVAQPCRASRNEQLRSILMDD
jgi:hypothetical protein